MEKSLKAAAFIFFCQISHHDLLRLRVSLDGIHDTLSDCFDVRFSCMNFLLDFHPLP